MAKILAGKDVVLALESEARVKVEALKERGCAPCMAIVRLGENDGDVSYERSASKRAAGIGLEIRNYRFPQDASEQTLLDCVTEINTDKTIHGALLLRPFPKHINDGKIRAALSPDKDIDGITDGSLAGVFTNTRRGFAPCTAEACMRILSHYGIEPQGKRAVVIGRSLVIGRPVAMLLMHKNATVTICHTKTRDLPAVVREADIVVAAAGVCESVSADFLRPGQTVLDVGIHVKEDGKMAGDVNFAEAETLVDAITPVPGGVGLVTTCVAALHTLQSAEASV